jgi:arylsulfatase A-like enzyme
VGRILEYLDGRGLLDDTIVVSTADHGDMLGAHGLFEKGYPLHYEETLRVPLIVADPDHRHAERPRALASLMDVLPTVAELAGVALPDDSERQGMSLAATVRGEKTSAPRAHVIAETFAYGGTESGAGTHRDFAHFEEHDGSANLSIRTDTARYVFRWNDEDELFDLTADPHEITNVACDPPYRETIEVLRATLQGEIGRTDQHFAAAVDARMTVKAA